MDIDRDEKIWRDTDIERQTYKQRAQETTETERDNYIDREISTQRFWFIKTIFGISQNSRISFQLNRLNLSHWKKVWFSRIRRSIRKKFFFFLVSLHRSFSKNVFFCLLSIYRTLQHRRVELVILSLAGKM